MRFCHTPSFRLLIAIALAAPVALSSYAGGRDASSDMAWVPTRKAANHIEAIVKLPAGALPLDRYTRYYAGRTSNGKHLIDGLFAARSSDIKVAGSEIQLVSRIPGVQDGGCGFLDLRYDVDTDQIAFIQCHGVA